MLFRTHKLIQVFLALVILLAPMQFALAQPNTNSPSMLSTPADQTSMQHQHNMSSNMDMVCDDGVACTDCAYCSPALTAATITSQDKPTPNPQLPILVSRTSIDPAVEARPPKHI